MSALFGGLSKTESIPLDVYSLLHRAMLDAGHEFGLSLSDVRLLVALARRGGTSNTAELEEDLLGDPAQIRRSLLVCRPLFCEGGTKRGVRAPIEITTRGRQVVDAVAGLLQPTDAAVAA